MKKKKTEAKVVRPSRSSSMVEWEEAYQNAQAAGPEEAKRFEARLMRLIGPIIEKKVLKAMKSAEQSASSDVGNKSKRRTS